MANQFNIARPYAKAAFDIAKASDDLALWSKILHVFSVVVSEKIVRAWLNDPVVTKDQWCDFFIGFLNTICKDAFSQTQNKIENFMRLLAEYSRFDALPEIFILFERYLARAKGYKNLSVKTPFLMNAQEQVYFKELAAQKLKMRVEADCYVDSSLIGGLVISTGNWVLDDSFSNKLKRLESALI